jgi:hypothetical protein
MGCGNSVDRSYTKVDKDVFRGEVTMVVMKASITKNY